KVAEAAAVLTDEDFSDLRELAGAAGFNRYVQYNGTFTADNGLPLSPERRRRLLDTFHRYGIWLSCRLIRDEDVSDPADLRRLLVERSGLPDLHAELTGRFAGHSGLIKVGRAVQQVRRIPGLLPPDSSERDRDLAGRAVDVIASLAVTEPSFAEFDLL